MDPESVERRLAAIISADVAGYSRLMADDEAATIRTLADYREEIAVLVRQHRGRVVDTAGDSLLAEFPTALDAVRCAVEMQGVLKARNASLPPDRRMEFRCGVHLGDVAVEDERIYGEGVNVAARLEGLAEPGGICISDMVLNQVEGKLDLRCEDLGEQSLKNIPKPVHAFRVWIEAASAAARAEPRPRPRALVAVGVVLVLAVGSWALWHLARRPPTTPEGGAPAAGPEAPLADGDLTVPGFAGVAAIAVLPFDNLSGDPEQEYFADGITEDLITRLSSLRSFPVIARNSTFTYKGKAADVKQVSRELGARYVVEGSVRKAGDRVRISTQLIDGTTGHHLWAETYDRDLRDIFALQDEITLAIVASIGPELWQSEWKRALRQEPQNLDAWDCVMRGYWHYSQGTREENAKARSWFERAIELDPQFSNAFAGLAFTHWSDAVLEWTDTPAKSVSELSRAARRSVELDANRAMNQLVLSLAYRLTGQPEEMIAAAERAVELNPSNSLAHSWLGSFLATRGRLEEGLVSAERAIRLSPRDPLRWFYFHNLAIVHFHARRYEDAVDWERRSIQGNRRFPYSRALLAASYAHLGRLDEARAALEELLRVKPGFSIGSYKLLFPTVDPDFAERHIEGLRKAGLEE